jgi:hypothetical protein
MHGEAEPCTSIMPLRTDILIPAPPAPIAKSGLFEMVSE